MVIPFGVMNMALNYIVDPIYLFHAAPKEGFYVRPTRERHAGIVKNYPIEVAVIGPSTALPARPAIFRRYFGADFANLAMSGASAAEQSAVIGQLLAFQRPKWIIWDMTGLFGGSQQTPKTFPAFLYKNDLLSILRYLIGVETTAHSVSKLLNELRPMSIYDPMTMNEIFNEGFVYSAEAALNYLCNAQRQKIVASSDIKTNRDNFSKMILPLIVKNPDTKFIFYVPPSMYGAFLPYDQEQLNDYLSFKESIIADVVAHENAKVFDLEALDFIRSDLSNYYDGSHYSPHTIDLMIEAIANDSVPPFDRKRFFDGVERARAFAEANCPR
jgi:hypothetical protein